MKVPFADINNIRRKEKQNGEENIRLVVRLERKE